MNKSKILWLILILAVVIFGSIIYWAASRNTINIQTSPSPVVAAMSLEPKTGTYGVNDTFSVKINFDTKGQDVNAIQAQLNYDPSQLEIQGDVPVAANSSIFTSDINKKDSAGQVTVAFTTVADNFNGPGELGTIEFKALSPATSSSVTFNASNTLMAYTPPGGTSSDTIEIQIDTTDANFTLQ